MINVHVKIFAWTDTSIPLGLTPGSGIAGSHGECVFNFLILRDIVKLFSKLGPPLPTPPPPHPAMQDTLPDVHPHSRSSCCQRFWWRGRGGGRGGTGEERGAGV